MQTFAETTNEKLRLAVLNESWQRRSSADILKQLGEEIDYTNFKTMIAEQFGNDDNEESVQLCGR